MKLVSIKVPPSFHTGVLIDDDVLDFSLAGAILPMASWVPMDMRRLLAAGNAGLAIISGLIEAVRSNATTAARLRRAGALKRLDQVQLGAPIPQPGILLSHGRAYQDHLTEMRGAGAKPSEDPSGFLKNSNSIVGSGEPIVIPAHYPDMVDFEGEFSIVFGSRCHNVTADEAMDHVIGYTIVNDVSARNWVGHFRSTGNPDHNRAGKQFPSFSPMGPVIATKDEVPDPHALSLVTTLNGVVMQNAKTDNLIWRIPVLIAHFAQWYCFEPGDVLTTGSPSGVGFGRKPPVFMKPGDVVAIDVTGVGTLVNPIMAA